MYPHSFAFLVTIIPLFISCLASNVQKPGLTLPPNARSQRDVVEQMFNRSYTAYKEHAFSHDSLAPVTQSFIDSRNGWGATLVDAMSTMFIMGLNDSFNEAVQFSSRIDFSKSKTSDAVSVFESTIRYLGGLLSAYELSGRQFPDLLTKARELGDKLSYAWEGNNDIPYGFLDFTTNTPLYRITNIAEAGTLAMEWYTLSKYTGNDKYHQLAEKSLRHIADLPAPLPGLAAQGISPQTGQPVGGYVTWGGGSDSYFEYLIKYPRLTNTEDATFVNTWKLAVDSSIKSLLRTSTVGSHVYLADYDDDKQIRHVSSHLACFHGGNWILGGRLLDNQTIVDYGLQLTDACWNTYASTATGIGPETFAFISSDGNYTGDGAINGDQLAFYNDHGFYVTDASYILRPEVLESNFYAWRATGDSKYLDRASYAIDNFNKHLSIPGDSFAGLSDVNYPTSARVDNMESFWFAETLKYLYLTFDDPSHISLDDYVFNTEAQLFKAPQPKQSYDTGTFKVVPNTPFKVQGGDLPAVSSLPKLQS